MKKSVQKGNHGSVAQVIPDFHFYRGSQMQPKKLTTTSVHTATLVFVVLWLLSFTCKSQIFVSNHGNGTVGEYDFNGTPINATLAVGLIAPVGIVASGTNIFVTDSGTTVKSYSTTGDLVADSDPEGI